MSPVVHRNIHGALFLLVALLGNGTVAAAGKNFEYSPPALSEPSCPRIRSSGIASCITRTAASTGKKLISATKQMVAHTFHSIHHLERTGHRPLCFLAITSNYAIWFIHCMSEANIHPGEEFYKTLALLRTILMGTMHCLAGEYGWAMLYPGLHCTPVPKDYALVKSLLQFALPILRIHLNTGKQYYSPESSSGCVVTKASYTLKGIADTLVCNAAAQ